VATAAVVSFRLGGTDGVSVESAKWCGALRRLGFEVTTVAGEGPVDHLIEGLAIAPSIEPDPAALVRALSGADLVVVENLCSLPLNPAAWELVATVCRGRPALLHHHDLSWQRPDRGTQPPPDDPAWRHVTVNERSRKELAEHGIEATTIYNRFDTAARRGERDCTRDGIGVGPGDRLFLQPTRALPRKNVGAGMALAEAFGATFWLLGPAEDGYGPTLDALVGACRCPVVLGHRPTTGAADAYAASDVVLLPSTWEGFGNPAVESAIHRRPLVIGPYPVASELAAFGFQWFGLDDADALARWLARPNPALLAHNWAVADAHFSLRDLPTKLAGVLGTLAVGL
jgi:glycosyltransferase involved in cell wall biosynthesis